MSFVAEIGEFLGGAINEYARHKRWSRFKTFAITSFSVFSVVAIHVILFPSAKDKWTGIFIAAVFGITMGLCGALSMSFEMRRKAGKPGGRD